MPDLSLERSLNALIAYRASIDTVIVELRRLERRRARLVELSPELRRELLPRLRLLLSPGGDVAA